MIETTRRNLSVYSAILAMIPKQFMAYQLWFWVRLVLNVISMAVLVFDNHLFAQYPLSIYPNAIVILLTRVIPYGFASFYPASYSLNRDVGNLAWFGPWVATFLLFIGYRFWQFGLKNYSGTGT